MGLMIPRLYSYFLKRESDVWVFTEWYGDRCCDNSAFLANYISMTYPQLNLYWICKENTDVSLLNDNIKVLLKGSKEATRVLKKASVYVVNQGIGEFGAPNLSGNAIVLNLWHGVMWKKIGIDSIPKIGPLRHLKYMVDRHFNTYIYECPSEEYKSNIITAFGAKDTNCIMTGQPRNTWFFSYTEVAARRNEILKMLRENFHYVNENTKIITYMPSFRDKTDLLFDFLNFKNFNQLQEFLIVNNAIIVQKAHYVSIKRNSTTYLSSDIRIIDGNAFIAQHLLAASDVLITDYSSCFFDFLLLDRPIIHYLYDYEDYVYKDRGLYYPYEEVCCGDTIFKEEQLIKAIERALTKPKEGALLRETRRKKFQTYESVDSCRIIADLVINRMHGIEDK